MSFFETCLTGLFGIEYGVLPLGMVSGRINEVKPVKEIVDEIVAEADEVIEKLAKRKYLKA